ncbi:LPXTG cell wall anchor domain-containing protein [uncultured Limosilactobacillus sp.]|nr:LPXTG cell wall anchor domain-containing protein [uncultured Limosilactobacillus sp.]
MPQTGTNNQAAVLGLGMGAVASLLGFLGLNKKRKN